MVRRKHLDGHREAGDPRMAGGQTQLSLHPHPAAARPALVSPSSPDRPGGIHLHRFRFREGAHAVPGCASRLPPRLRDRASPGAARTRPREFLPLPPRGRLHHGIVPDGCDRFSISEPEIGRLLLQSVWKRGAAASPRESGPLPGASLSRRVGYLPKPNPHLRGRSEPSTAAVRFTARIPDLPQRCPCSAWLLTDTGEAV